MVHLRVRAREMSRAAKQVFPRILVAVSLIAVSFVTSGVAATPADAAPGDIPGDGIMNVDLPATPSWLTFSGGSDVSYVSKTKEGIVADEFGHLDKADAERFKQRDLYGPASAALNGAGVQKGVAYTPFGATGAGAENAIVLTNTQMKVLGSQTSGFAQIASLDYSNTDGPKGTPVGVAVLQNRNYTGTGTCPFGPCPPPVRDEIKEVIVAVTTQGFWYYRLNGSTLTFEGHQSDPINAFDMPPSGFLDVYQRPTWDHYRYESDLPTNEFAIFGKTNTGLRAKVITWDDWTEAVSGPGATFIDAGGNDSSMDVGVTPSTVVSGAVRYDITPGKFLSEKNYRIATLHYTTPAGGVSAGRLTRYGRHHTSDPTFFTDNPEVFGIDACPSSEATPIPALDMQVMRIESTSPSEGYGEIVGCASVSSGDVRTEIHRRENFENDGTGIINITAEDAPMFTDSTYIETTPTAPTRPAIQVDYPCMGWLTRQPDPGGLSFTCMTDDGRTTYTDTAVPSSASALVLFRDGTTLKALDRSWQFTFNPFLDGSPTLAHWTRDFETGQSFDSSTPVRMLRVKPDDVHLKTHVTNRNSPILTTTEPRPVALLVVPPYVKGANQTVQQSEFANTQGTGSTTGDSREIHFGVQTGYEMDLGSIYEVDLTLMIGAEFGAEESSSLDVAINEFYQGTPTDNAVVYQTERRHKYLADVLETSTGVAANQTNLPILFPLASGSATVVASMQTFKDRYPGTFNIFTDAFTKPVSQGGALPTPGNPGTYVGRTSNAMDDYCAGDETFSLPRLAHPQPFVLNPPVPPGPDFLLGNSTIVEAGTGSSAVKGTEFTIDSTQEQTLSTKATIDADGFVSIDGWKIGGFIGGSWGSSQTSRVVKGTSFSGGVGDIPNAALSNESYEWQAFLCRHNILSGVGGPQESYAPWVLNFGVSDYHGSGGLEDLADVGLTQPIHSETTVLQPSFAWRQATGTIKNFDLELEAVGASDYRKVTGLLPAADTASANARGPDYAISFLNAGLPSTGRGGDLLKNQQYRWRVTATDFFGNTKTSPYEFFMTQGPPGDLKLLTSNPAPVVNQSVTLTAEHTGATSVINYHWNLGDGRTETTGSNQLVTSWDTAGTYPVQVEAETAIGSAFANNTESIGPDAHNDAYNADEGTPLHVNTPGVLTNDAGGETAALKTQPTNGTVTMASDGSFTYTPTVGTCGPDSFTYTSRGGGIGRTATVNIAVTCAATVTINQKGTQPDPAGTAPINFDVTFSEPVNGFTPADITLQGTAGATTAVVTGAGPTYNVAVSGMTAPGTVTATIPAGKATSAANGLANRASTSTDNTVTFDNAGPKVSIEQGATQIDPTKTPPITYHVTFDEPVLDFATNDVTLSGTAGATTAVVTGSGTAYDVTVSGMTNSGTVIATLGAGVAHDNLGHPNDPSTSVDNTVTFDVNPAAVTINQASTQADPTNAPAINFTAQFNEPVTGFDGTDVSVGGTAGATTAVVTGGPATYNVAVSGMTTNGTVTATVPAGAALDTATNASAASTSTDNVVTYDDTQPWATVDQASTQADPTSGAPVHFTAVFSRDVTGFDGTDVTFGGTALPTGAVVTGGPSSYDIAVSGMTQTGTVTASVGAAKALDSGSHANTASTSSDNTVLYDVTGPTVTVNQASTQADPTLASPISFTVKFDAPVTDFDSADPVVSGTAGATTPVVTGSGDTYNVDVTGMTHHGTVVVTIPAGAAKDSLLNGNLASTSSDNVVTFDRAPVATGDAYTADLDTPLIVPPPGVVANDTDPDGDTLSAIVVAAPVHGSLFLNPNGSLTYAPYEDYIGPDAFTYRASDGAFTSNTVTVDLTVRAACAGKAATIIGTPNNDTLPGTAGDDVIVGLGGNDVITGDRGNDLLCGGSGDDTLFGNAGNDTQNGGTGADLLRGHGGADVLFGGKGDDQLYGNGGPDTLEGEDATDLLVGGPGKDRFRGGFGAADKCVGSGGRDRLLPVDGCESKRSIP